MANFTVRTKTPVKGDPLSKCYKRKASGGWSNCIKGKPMQDYCDVLCNCVGAANGRFNEIYDEINKTTGCKWQFKCNAELFPEQAEKYGLAMGSVPKPGAIGVLQKGETLSKEDGYGHVFSVEKVLDYNPKAYKVYTFESGYDTKRTVATWNSTRSNTNGRYGAGSKYKFRTFIYNPAVVVPSVTPAVKRNTKVNQIKLLKDMNVRVAIETSSESIGYVKTGTIFNYYGTKKGKSSLWYAITKEKDQWIAGSSLKGSKKYVTVYKASKTTKSK